MERIFPENLLITVLITVFHAAALQASKESRRSTVLLSIFDMQTMSLYFIKDAKVMNR